MSSRISIRCRSSGTRSASSRRRASSSIGSNTARAVVGRQIAVRGEPGPHQIVPQIGDQHAERAQDAGGRRDQEARDRQFARQGRAVHRPGAAERHQGQAARVVAALDRDDADAARHLRVGDAQDAGGGFDQVETERPAMRVAMARVAASASSGNSPPSLVSPPSRPSTRFASVTVGSAPPRP